MSTTALISISTSAEFPLPPVSRYSLIVSVSRASLMTVLRVFASKLFPFSPIFLTSTPTASICSWISPLRSSIDFSKSALLVDSFSSSSCFFNSATLSSTYSGFKCSDSPALIYSLILPSILSNSFFSAFVGSGSAPPPPSPPSAKEIATINGIKSDRKNVANMFLFFMIMIL